jgi:hypothetical protein
MGPFEGAAVLVRFQGSGTFFLVLLFYLFILFWVVLPMSPLDLE